MRAPWLAEALHCLFEFGARVKNRADTARADENNAHQFEARAARCECAKLGRFSPTGLPRAEMSAAGTPPFVGPTFSRLIL